MTKDCNDVKAAIMSEIDAAFRRVPLVVVNSTNDHLKSFIERIERLETDKSAVCTDIKEVYAEAKSTGFDPKIMRQIVRIRRLPEHERREQEELLDMYMAAVGMAGGGV